MRLSKLEIYGFKSFAKRTEIAFLQNVTGIVGPNGSGKSNIADAVRWVLGEQSAKMLRGNNMADVIFNGTETKRPMNYCEVTLVFDNTDHQLSSEFSEVSVTRRVYRSGESEYQLNGSTCRLKDIIELFRDTGVGKEGYSIIGQGRIDEILSQRSEERRAVFEEAAGISRYRTRKEEAESRLRRADENLIRVLDILEELQSHLEPLRQQAEVAKEFLTLSEQLKELDVELFLVRHDRLKEREQSVEQALYSIKDTILEANTALETFTLQRSASEEALEAAQSALKTSHEALLQKTNALHAVREEATQTENRLSRNQETLERLQGEEESLLRRQALLHASLTQQDGGLTEAQAQQTAAQAALEEKKTLHSLATENAQTLEDKLTDHKTALMENLNRMQNVRTSHARQTAMQTQMIERRKEISAELEQSSLDIQGLEQAFASAETNLTTENSRYTDLKNAADSLEETTKQMLADILSKQKLAQEAAQSARGLDMRLRTLRELQEGLDGYQYAVKNALQYAKQQKLPGVCGVVAMLLQVPKELETAMDMALGGAMQNIVTKDEQAAKSMIEHLRQNHLGRATFLPLSTVRGRVLNTHERKVLTMKGCLGLASELCQFEETYRPIMENLLGRTVVAEDLDSGIAIMRAGGHSFRLVTLAGDVMHSGGSITGGSIQQRAQNLLGRDREIRELKAALQEKNQLIEREEAALAALENERAGSKERREAAQHALHQQEIAVVRDTERRHTAQQALEDHRTKTEQMRQAYIQLDESLRDIETELSRLEQQTTAQETNTEDMNLQTETLSNSLESARRSREASQEALTAAMLRLQEAEHTCQQIQRDQKRLFIDQAACERELAALQTKRQQITLDIQAVYQAQLQAHQAIAEKEEALNEAKTHVEVTEKQRNATQQTVKDIQVEIEAAQSLVNRESDRLHRQEMAQERVKSDLLSLTQRLWDSYELTYAGAQEALTQFQSLRNAETGESSPGVPPFQETEAETKAQELRDLIRRMGTVNVGAIEEYTQMHERFIYLTAQQEDLEQAKRDLIRLIERLLEQMKTVFVGQFSLLQEYFSQTFSRLFGGGHGEIQLSDPGDPLNCGIEIIVQPPGKKRQILSLFSGGERALTAIAILFAMLMLKPTPFCILDEIEAALDEANITYFADYLKEFSRDTQFVVVTHRKGTMERCDTLFGVAMEERGVSSMVSVNLTDYE